MSGHVLILNAGSSSLKFRVYELGQTADGWNVAAGGQIEGIGTAPRLHAKDGAGKAIADEKLAGKSDAGAARCRPLRSDRGRPAARAAHHGADRHRT